MENLQDIRIDLLEPGPDLDALVARLLDVDVQPFSTNLASSMEAAMLLRGRDWLVCVKLMPDQRPYIVGPGIPSEYDGEVEPDAHLWHGQVMVEIEHMPSLWGESSVLVMAPYGMSKEPPLAICRAVVSAFQAIQRQGVSS